jgi:hypothetical protein
MVREGERERERERGRERERERALLGTISMVRHRRRCNTGICVYEASVEVQYRHMCI